MHKQDRTRRRLLEGAESRDEEAGSFPESPTHASLLVYSKPFDLYTEIYRRWTGWTHHVQASCCPKALPFNGKHQFPITSSVTDTWRMNPVTSHVSSRWHHSIVCCHGEPMTQSNSLKTKTNPQRQKRSCWCYLQRVVSQWAVRV